MIQGPIVVVFLGILMNYLFQNNILNFSLAADQVVNLPEPKNFTEFIGLFTFPDFSVLTSYKVYEVAIVLAVDFPLLKLLYEVQLILILVVKQKCQRFYTAYFF